MFDNYAFNHVYAADAHNNIFSNSHLTAIFFQTFKLHAAYWIY